MKLDELKSRILLNMIPDIGPVRSNRLIAYFGSAVKIFSSNAEEIGLAANINKSLSQKILSSANEIDVDKEIERARKSGIEILTPDSPDYPVQIKTNPDPPVVLYSRGKIKKEDIFSIAIVGTRKPTEYGKIVTNKITKELIEMGVTIISGLARGVDTIAHWTAVKSNKRTIAVLGNGLGVHYPPENRNLEDKITETGALVSEFNITCSPDKGNFPRRNRIISGLSLGTVVIEGDEKSGALITAKHAAEQGRDIFAVPGSIMSKYSHGPHLLIKQGAKLVENAQDIMEDVSFISDLIRSKTRLEVQNKNNSKELSLLSAFEEKILTELESVPDGINIDKLHDSIKCSFGQLSESLISLEMKGMLKSLPGKMYLKT